MKTENKTDFKEALKYLLSPIPLRLCHNNETKKICKARIYSLIDYHATTPESAYKNVTFTKTCIFDLMVVIRCVGIFKIIKELIF